ncbi:TIGR04219 family outer membrane beta-barrel protein [Shewanella sp. WXL01]|uniref:TIGR04219 family outer membrane beta-barrel protein n=1 Tax=Shewanella maritima TaxID=2520507 RepID=A0A411PG27_9GAMM|nr:MULTISPECIES: TIGR04219 family outer membrane beta-barrel protein [Shewanella]NKF49481.1 TIGR04219 family outer membrane beta-barrel protein [Shewanella sp. WXL01]QBF82414.1 TIGR04219 family outer membrane beta-barrel protein [Shewanella maritima]
MKKSLIATALVGLMSVSTAQAATVVGFKVGGDLWQADPEGTLSGDAGTRQDINYESNNRGSFWVAVEHPIPLIPNVKIRENSIDNKGAFTADDKDYTVYNKLSNTDFVLYYELLDNSIVELDIGAAYKKFHGSVRVDYMNAPAVGFPATDVDSGVVMGYVNGQASIPGLGLFAFAELMQGVDESGVHDYSAGLGWEFDGVALDTRIRVGYREFNFDVNGFSGTTQDTKTKGAFAGVELVF